MLFILIVGIVSFYKFGFNSKGFVIFNICFISFGIIQFMRYAKTFHLHQDKLIIKRPLFLTEKINVVFKTENIKEIIFKKIDGRFGGPFINIYSKDLDESYRINFSEREITEFSLALEKMNIKTKRENL